MENYQVTIYYKAVITVDVKAESHEEAQAYALKEFKDKEREKWYNRRNINLQDDSFGVSGSVNTTESWEQL